MHKPGSMMWWWENPPAPFNPDRNQDYINRCGEYDRRLKEFARDASFDHLSDAEYDQLLNAKAVEWKKQLRIYNYH